MKRNLKATLSFLTMMSLTCLAVSLQFSGDVSLKILGIMLFSLLIWPWFSVFHTCGHNAYFSNRILNDLTGYLSSSIVGIPFYMWKIHHAEHHKWTGFLEKDPTGNEYELPSYEKLTFLNVLWKLWIPFISLVHVITHLWNYKSVVKRIRGSQRLRNKIISSYVIFFILHASYIYLLGLHFYLPWLVAIAFFLLTSDIILLSQHAFIPHRKSSQRPLRPEEHYRYTRSISFGHFIDRYLLLNFGEHSKHHRYPLRSHFELPKEHLPLEKRVNGWKWIIQIKSMHIRDVLNPVWEKGHE